MQRRVPLPRQLDHLDGPVFEPLKDPSYFRRFAVNSDIDTIAWPNGSDFSPDFLYEIGKPLGESTHPSGAVSSARHPPA